MVTETNGGGSSASIAFLGGGNPTGERNAWWHEGEGLLVIDSLPRLLAKEMAHPFGTGREDVLAIYGEPHLTIRNKAK